MDGQTDGQTNERNQSDFIRGCFTNVEGPIKIHFLNLAAQLLCKLDRFSVPICDPNIGAQTVGELGK